jgi:hypothetical protein
MRPNGSVELRARQSRKSCDSCSTSSWPRISASSYETRFLNHATSDSWTAAAPPTNESGYSPLSTAACSRPRTRTSIVSASCAALNRRSSGSVSAPAQQLRLQPSVAVRIMVDVADPECTQMVATLEPGAPFRPGCLQDSREPTTVWPQGTHLEHFSATDRRPAGCRCTCAREGTRDIRRPRVGPRRAAPNGGHDTSAPVDQEDTCVSSARFSR